MSELVLMELERRMEIVRLERLIEAERAARNELMDLEMQFELARLERRIEEERASIEENKTEILRCELDIRRLVRLHGVPVGDNTSPRTFERLVSAEIDKKERTIRRARREITRLKEYGRRLLREALRQRDARDLFLSGEGRLYLV